MATRDLDVVVWGCTGFTGSLATAYLSGDASKFFSFKLDRPGAPAGLRWAVAGRNKAKIDEVRQGCGCPADVETIIADAGDKAAIEAFVRRTRCVAAFAGPFVRYSDLVVEACAKYGTHYVDICGEPAWVRSCVDRYGDRARATGACIVNFTGYDSIPSDLGCLFAVDAVRNKAGDARVGIKSVINFQLPLGGMSGGSLQTGLAALTHPTVLTKGVDVDSPFVLGGETAAGVRPEDGWQTEAGFDDRIGAWTGPFGMEKINAPATRRSSAALGYGKNFNYQEVAIAGSEKMATKLSRQAKTPAPPQVIEKLIADGRLPKPGEGPSEAVRAKARFLSLLLVEADDGTKTAVEVSGGEAGYEETAKMCVESALALVLQPAECPGHRRAGFQSTAECMGRTLIGRLQRAGIRFQEVADPKARLAQYVGMTAKL